MVQDGLVVLLVEDEPLIAFVLEEELNEEGFQVVAAGEAGIAIELIERNEVPFRALITDIDLGGGLTGWEVAQRGREINANLPVIYMSGKSAIEWSANGVPESFMLQKPFVFAQLLTALSSLLNVQPPPDGPGLID